MADTNVLDAQTREGTGKGSARKLRAKGLIPAIVYGKHLEKPASVAVDPILVRKALATPHKLNTLMTLKAPGGNRQVLLKDFQIDPLSREMLHADFIEVRDNEKVKIKVPLVLTGKPAGAAEGGILSVHRRDLEVWALPKAIPEKIEVDVSHLKIAQAMHINEAKLPAGIEVKTHVNYTLAVVSVPEKEEVAPVAAVPAVGAAAAPAAGGKEGAAAPAAGAKEGAAAPAAGAKKEGGDKGKK